MNILNTAFASGPNPAVRLIGIGGAGRRFVERFHSQVAVIPGTPLDDLLHQIPSFIELDAGLRADAAVQAAVEGTRILCLAIASDMTSEEVDLAMTMIWTMWGQGAHVIGIVIASTHDTPVIADAMFDTLCDAIDARVDIGGAPSTDELAPLQWFYCALQRSVLEGLSILEPAWDHTDVVEVLDLGGVQLELFLHLIDGPERLDSAMADLLEQVADQGVCIETALGAVIVLWAPPEYRLTVRAVRSLGRVLDGALGAGALHLTIRLSSRTVKPIPAAYLTLVVSRPKTKQS